jgi:SNF2 family DNA or RNA helicase
VLPVVTRTATLDPTTWKIYKEMRDEMVAWLSDATVSVAAQTITKIMRLSQITSGFVGGLEPEIFDEINEGRPGWLPVPEDNRSKEAMDSAPTREISREKLDVLLEEIDQLLEADSNLKLLIWCRFIPELDRLLKELTARYPQAKIGCIAGKALLRQSKREERDAALRLLNPQTAPEGPAMVAGTYGTGSLGLNLTACHTVINLSYDYSYFKFVQSAARVDRPGQVSPISTFDIIAEGPKGQRTIDHTIARARRDKEDIAVWTTSAWVRALTEE